MTELQSSISSLKKVITSGNELLSRLEETQKDLETPPQHKWEHGDIFENRYGTDMICIEDMRNGQKSQIRVYCLTGPGCDCTHNTAVFLEKAKFLFNIKEKL
jgi:hypothetical protein